MPRLLKIDHTYFYCILSALPSSCLLTPHVRNYEFFYNDRTNWHCASRVEVLATPGQPGDYDALAAPEGRKLFFKVFGTDIVCHKVGNIAALHSPISRL